jgi:hypothetical protein
VNTGACWPSLDVARSRVLGMQAKLHRWAGEDSGRRFDDLFNLVGDPHFLAVAWERVSGNTGGRTAGVDGLSARSVAAGAGVEAFLRGIRDQLKAGTFRPLPVRERMIPKPGTGKKRRLGIPTITDRVVQAALKLVLEPIFERDCAPRGAGLPGGVRDLAGLLSQQGSRSWGQPDPGGAGEGGKQPRQRSGDVVLPDASAALARREGIAIANECLMPRDSKTAPNLVDMGRCSAGRVSIGGLPASWSSIPYDWGDREESLRRTRGDAVGVKLDPDPADRWAVNVGSVWASPHPSGSRPGGGQVHRRLTTLRRGRALVVVRAQESCAHGEGGQQICGREWSRGGRR